MSLRTMLVIGLALFCGFVASFAVSRTVGSVKVQQVAKPETTPVVVCTLPLSRGKVVTADAVAVRAWPKDMMPANAVSDVEAVIDRVALSPIEPGELLLSSKLADRSSGRGLSALIPTGMRAYTVEVSNVASNVAGFILPGSRVDVLLTLKGGFNDETGGGSTMTLLQAVEVLAVDQDLQTPEENPEGAAPRQSNSVTLLITPEQAPVLDLGQNMGTLTLSLRNPSDTAQETTTTATLTALHTMQQKAAEGDDGAAVAALLEQAALAQAQAEGEDAEELEQPQVYEIRTLRGNSVGRIHVVQPRR